jgi:D-3-phosphoglycerate dehydrogenase
MIDTEGEVTEEVEKAISQIDGVLKVRVLL